MHYVRNAQRLLLLRVKIQKILGGHTMTSVIHRTLSGYSHECEIVGEGEEVGRKVYDLACGKWAWEEQVKIQKKD